MLKTLVVALTVLSVGSPHAAAHAADDVRAKLLAGDCDGCDVIDADLSGLDLQHRTLRLGVVRNVNFNGANLSGAIVNGSLNGSFTDARLDGAHISGSLTGSFLRTNLARIEVKGLVQGTFEVVDLSSGVLLNGIVGNVTGSTLRDVRIENIQRGNDNRGDFVNSNLDGARLTYTNCYHSQFDKVSLKNAKIDSHGVWRFCNFTDSDLTGVYIHGWMYSQNFIRTNLTNAVIALEPFGFSPSWVRVENGSLDGARVSGDVRDVHFAPDTFVGFQVNGETCVSLAGGKCIGEGTMPM